MITVLLLYTLFHGICASKLTFERAAVHDQLFLHYNILKMFIVVGLKF